LSAGYSPVHKLAVTDRVDAFDCGQAALNQFLQRYALVNQKANSAQTYVCCRKDEVVGFYSLAVGSIDADRALKGEEAVYSTHLLRSMVREVDE